MYLGIDVGVSGVKAALVNETDAMVATWRRKTSALLSLLEITRRVIKRIEPQPTSDCQNLLENIVHHNAWRLHHI